MNKKTEKQFNKYGFFLHKREPCEQYFQAPHQTIYIGTINNDHFFTDLSRLYKVSMGQLTCISTKEKIGSRFNNEIKHRWCKSFVIRQGKIYCVADWEDYLNRQRSEFFTLSTEGEVIDYFMIMYDPADLDTLHNSIHGSFECGFGYSQVLLPSDDIRKPERIIINRNPHDMKEGKCVILNDDAKYNRHITQLRGIRLRNLILFYNSIDKVYCMVDYNIVYSIEGCRGIYSDDKKLYVYIGDALHVFEHIKDITTRTFLLALESGWES